jgi:hypothetical protein
MNPDKDVTILLNGLDKIVAFCLVEESSHDDFWRPEEEKDANDRNSGVDNAGSFSLRSYVTSALLGDTSTSSHDHVVDPSYIKSRDAVLTIIPGILLILMELYSIMSKDPFGNSQNISQLPRSSTASSSHVSNEFDNTLDFSSAPSLSFICHEIKYRIHRFVQVVFSSHPNEFVESMIEVWFTENVSFLQTTLVPSVMENEYNSGDGKMGNISLSMLHVAALPKIVIQAVLDGLKTRISMLNGNVILSNGRRLPFSSQALYGYLRQFMYFS